MEWPWHSSRIASVLICYWLKHWVWYKNILRSKDDEWESIFLWCYIIWDELSLVLSLHLSYLDETLYTHTTLVGTSKQLQKNMCVETHTNAYPKVSAPHTKLPCLMYPLLIRACLRHKTFVVIVMYSSNAMLVKLPTTRCVGLMWSLYLIGHLCLSGSHMARPVVENGHKKTYVKMRLNYMLKV